MEEKEEKKIEEEKPTEKVEENNKKEEKQDDKEFLKEVEKAAEKGARKASGKQTLIVAIIIAAIIGFIYFEFGTSLKGIKSLFETGSVEGHDFTLGNSGILGYTVADFEDAVMGCSSKIQKLEVYQQEMSDEVTIESAGLGGLKVFTSTQEIKYKGTAVYTVDLSQVTGSAITVDNDQKIVTITIPHAVQEEININESDMEVSDTEKGFMRFSEIEMTVQSLKEIQAMAREKMETKLEEQDILSVADTYALKGVEELYGPMIRAIAKGYSLEVKFAEAEPAVETEPTVAQ